jgi:hypothetical protein
VGSEELAGALVEMVGELFVSRGVSKFPSVIEIVGKLKWCFRNSTAAPPYPPSKCTVFRIKELREGHAASC